MLMTTQYHGEYRGHFEQQDHDELSASTPNVPCPNIYQQTRHLCYHI